MSYVYVAGPIDSATSFDVHVMEITRSQIKKSGIAYFSPHGAWNAKGSIGSHLAITEINELAIRNASAVFAVVSQSLSIGVPAELEFARMAGVPAIVLCDPTLADHQSLRALSTAGLFTSVEPALARLRTIIADADGVRIGYVKNVSKTSEALPVPEQKNPGDIGLDLYVSESTTIPAGEWRGIPSGIAIAPPEDIWFLICGRSSALHGRGLVIPQSVIDSGFRGPLFALAHNISKSDVTVARGERIAQLLPLPMTKFRFIVTDELPQSARGENGFGSTGA